jgi:acetyltransferase
MPRGRRVAVITNSGGTGVELADLLADEGLTVPELSAGLQNELRAMLPGYGSAVNPVDMTPAWSLFTTVYPAAVDLLARSGEVDVVVPVLLQRSASAEVAAAVRDAVARLRADRNQVPVYVCWVAPRSADVHTHLLQDAGIPCFAWPQRTAQAVGTAVRCGVQLADSGSAAASAGKGSASAGERTPQLALAARRPQPVQSGHEPASLGLMTPEAAHALLAAAGVPVIETVRCDSPAVAAKAAERLGYPAVVKVDHPDLTHKSDAGGVRLGLDSPDAVRAAAADLLALADGAAVLVQRQHQGLELLIGGIRDPEFGAVIVAGFGGVLVEAQRDVQLAVAPVDARQATAMLRALRGAAVFGGLRGRAAVDLSAVATLVATVSELMADNPRITELDLNPVLVSAAGCLAVDWRIRVSPA